MNRLVQLYNRYVQLVCRGPGARLPISVLEDLIEELRKVGVTIDDDAVCFVMASRLWGGTIGQLTHDSDDPGYVNRASGATEGFYPRDLCGSARRKNRGMAMAVRTFEPTAFLAQDPTSTLYNRAQLFEDTLADLIEEKLHKLE